MAGGWDCGCGATGLSGPRCAACGRPAPWYEPPPTRFVPTPRRRDLGLGRLGGTIAVALVVLLAFSLNRTTALTARQNARERAAFAAELAELREFVARERGRPFQSEVRVSLLGDKEFEFVALGTLHDDGGDRTIGEQGIGTTLRTLGIEARTEPDGDSDNVLGGYDVETREVYIRGRTLTPFVKATVVHELTHAWQDQHLGLAEHLEEGLDGDAALARDALVEGDAERVAQAWLATQPAADQAEVARQWEVEMTPVSRLLWAWDGFPYLNGPDFVRALARRGGNAAVDRAFDRPPASTAQVLHVDKYVSNAPVERVERPRAFGSKEDSGMFGEAGLAVIVARGEPDAEARAAVSGWAGDAYVTWHDGPAVCTDMVVRMDSRESRDRLIRALRTRTQPGDDVLGQGTDELRARFCV